MTTTTPQALLAEYRHADPVTQTTDEHFIALWSAFENIGYSAIVEHAAWAADLLASGTEPVWLEAAAQTLDELGPRVAPNPTTPTDAGDIKAHFARHRALLRAERDRRA